MSKIEIVLAILACAVPVVALLFVLPKIKKKEKKEKKKVEVQTKTYEEVKKEETTQAEIKSEPVKEKKLTPKFENTDFGPDDFRSYLKHKQNISSKPVRVDLPPNFQDKTMPYFPKRKMANKKPQTVAEEICSLSPELKALIFTGALDKKEYD